MPFKEGTFSFKDEFTISVDYDGKVMITPEHPVSIRIAELFSSDNWTDLSAYAVAEGEEE